MQPAGFGDPPPTMAGGLVSAVARGLRAAGATVSTSEMLDAVRAVAAVDVRARDEVVDALRATLLKAGGWDDVLTRLCAALMPAVRPHPVPGDTDRATGGDRPTTTDDLLAALVSGDRDELDRTLLTSLDRYAGVDAAHPASPGQRVQRALRRLDLARVYQDLLRRAGAADGFARRVAAVDAAEQMAQLRRRLEELVAAGALDRDDARPDDLPSAVALEDIPLLHAGSEYIVALRAAVKPLARKLATRIGRRRRRGRGALDVRRTMRNSLGSGGVPLDPAMRRRHRTRPDLVVFCDVSGSTAQFAPFTLALLHALHGEFRRVRSFVFVDGIVEITELLADAPGVVDPRHLLAHRGLIAGDGRSDYRRVLRAFRDRWPDAVTSHTTVLVVGDARSHDRPAALDEVQELSARARRLYWLNPETAPEWDTGDSRMSLYATHCTGVFEVATLRQLGECVAKIAT